MQVFDLRWKTCFISDQILLMFFIRCFITYQDSSTWPKWPSFIGFWLHEWQMSLRSVVLISCVSFSFQVLVVDAGGSLRCGMLGDNLAAMAVKNNWAGVLMYGCIRDSEEIGQMKLGVRALGTMPLKSIKKGQGERDITVRFAGVNFTPGHYVYSDLDGIIVSPKELTLPPPKLWFLLKDNDFSRNN